MQDCKHDQGFTDCGRTCQHMHCVLCGADQIDINDVEDGFDIDVEFHVVDGFTLSAIVDGWLISRRYIDYPVEEAKSLFRQTILDNRLSAGSIQINH